MSELNRIAVALERIVEQNDAFLAIHRETADFNREATAKRTESDDAIVGYWEANERRLESAERRKQEDALIRSIGDSIERARAVAAARELVRLVDGDGDPIGETT